MSSPERAIQCCTHLHKGSRVHITGRLQTGRWADPDTGDVRLRTEIIASEVIFLGIQQSNLPPAYGFELGDLPEIGTADHETTARDDHVLNDTQ
jgi:single-stranded DNA-binding protein